MKNSIIKIISYLALAGTIIPSLMVFFSGLDLQQNKNIMAVSMIIWFATAPFWINRKSEEEATD